MHVAREAAGDRFAAVGLRARQYASPGREVNRPGAGFRIGCTDWLWVGGSISGDWLFVVFTVVDAVDNP
jgi:hypothetical protein